MSQQITINRHHLRHFQDISILGVDPISLHTCGKIYIHDILKLAIVDDKSVKINHNCLNQLLTKKNAFFLSNFHCLGLILHLMHLGSNINYQRLRNQFISMYENLLCKVITLHKQECNRIRLDPSHSSLKYLNLASKRVMVLQHNQNGGTACKVCSRGIELISARLLIKYGENWRLKTIDELSQIESLSSICQQWIFDKKKLILKSINLANVDHDNCDNYSCYQTYRQLLYDMNIIGQLKSFGCPFYVSNSFSSFKMIMNASNFYGTGKLTNVSNNVILHFCCACLLYS